MKKLLIIIVVVLFCNTNMNAQVYNNAIGLRGGFSSGINFKHFLSGENAFEVILATDYDGFLITGVYQRHTTAFDTPGLQWYYGAGGRIGFYDDNSILGIVGVVGLDYKIEDVPISLALDVMPRIHIIGNDLMQMGAGFSVRYVW